MEALVNKIIGVRKGLIQPHYTNSDTGGNAGPKTTQELIQRNFGFFGNQIEQGQIDHGQCRCLFAQ